MTRRHQVVRLLPRTDFDFSNLPDRIAVAGLPLVQDIDVAAWGSATLLVRVHAVVLQNGSYFQLDARAVAPTAEDPAQFFRDGVVATVRGPSAVVTAPSLLRTRLADHTGAAISLFLTVWQAKVGTCTFTLSVDLVLQERAGGWTPAELGAKLTLWLDQRDLVQVGDRYVAWGDQSPAGANDFAPALAGLEPLAGAAVNQLAAPDFVAASALALKSNTVASFVAAAAWHVFVVLRARSVTGSDPTAYLNDAVLADVSVGWWGLYLKNNIGGVEVHAFHWDSAVREAVATGLVLGEDTLIEWSFDGATIRCQLGGGLVATGGAIGGIGNTANQVYLGQGATGSQFFDGVVAAAIVCNEVLSEVDARQVREYLSSRYGVPA